jgi:hypothetical protein
MPPPNYVSHLDDLRAFHLEASRIETRALTSGIAMTQRKMYSLSMLHQQHLLPQPNALFMLYHPSLLHITYHRGDLLVLLVVVDLIVPATVGRISMRS